MLSKCISSSVLCTSSRHVLVSDGGRNPHLIDLFYQRGSEFECAFNSVLFTLSMTSIAQQESPWTCSANDALKISIGMRSCAVIWYAG